MLPSRVALSCHPNQFPTPASSCCHLDLLTCAQRASHVALRAPLNTPMSSFRSLLASCGKSTESEYWVKNN